MARTPESMLHFLQLQLQQNRGFRQFTDVKLTSFRENNPTLAKYEDDWLLSMTVAAGGVTLAQVILDQWEMKPEQDRRPV